MSQINGSPITIVMIFRLVENYSRKTEVHYNRDLVVYIVFEGENLFYINLFWTLLQISIETM